MALLLDLFGYLSVVVHGLVIVAQSMAIGSVLFLVFLANPLEKGLGPEGPPLATSVARVGAWSAVGLLVAEIAYLGLQYAAILGTLELSFGGTVGAAFSLAGIVKAAAAAILAAVLFRSRQAASRAMLLALCAVILASATATTHAAARVDGRGPLLLLSFLHLVGVSIWIGGIPVFVLALARLREGAAYRLAGARFSRMSMIGVAAILLSGALLSFLYIGDLQGFYGTAYGVMVGAKILMFGMLLLLGFGNLLLVERLRIVPGEPVIRMRRFAEAEIGIGFTIFFAAASLTSVPPAIDLKDDRATWAEIVERNTPQMPRLVSPDHDTLTIAARQAELDKAAEARGARAQAAFVPGSSELAPRNAADIAWSEYNHHLAGFFVLAIGALALLAQAGIGAARHWPLLFVGLGGLLAIRADPDVWPLGSQGLIESLRDVETLQHRAFEVVIFAFAFLEWQVQTRGLRTGWRPLVFPLMCALGGTLLLTHQHAVANVKDQLLIELSHTPLALAALVTGWSRWLELRLDDSSPRLRRVAGWIWPTGLLVIGLILVVYRES